MYEYPLMERDYESFLSDKEFHDACMGADDPDYASDDDYSNWVLTPPRKTTFSVQCQTEPPGAWGLEPLAAPIKAVRPEPGTTAAPGLNPIEAWNGEE